MEVEVKVDAVYFLEKYILCEVNYCNGNGWQEKILIGGLTYSLSNIKELENGRTYFELYDDQGLIGQYKVKSLNLSCWKKLS